MQTKVNYFSVKPYTLFWLTSFLLEEAAEPDGEVEASQTGVQALSAASEGVDLDEPGEQFDDDEFAMYQYRW